MGTGIEAYIADLSMTMAQQSVQGAAQTKILKNTMDDSTNAAMGLIESISELPSPQFGNVGGLLNTKA